MGRLHSIEVFRGLAALAVTWFHLTNSYAAGSPVRLSGALGWLGVDCFFVLSGFVIPYALYRANYETKDFARFMARRLVRLEPPYIASIVLVVALAYASSIAPGFAGNDPNYSAGQLGAHLLYLIPFTEFSWAQPVYWSLAYEFAFYIVMGLLFTTLWKCHIALTAAVSLAAYAVSFTIPGPDHERLMLFLFGIAAMRAFVKRDPMWVFLVCAGLNAAFLAFVAPLTAIAGLATALALVFVKLPAWAPLTGLGAISYSLYLTHVPIGGRVINLGKRFVEGEVQQMALSVFALAVSLAFAWIFYRVVEVGASALSKRISLKALERFPSIPVTKITGG
jgi:peptidoglycan/LPS O-acetylase OafA/YrhL